MSAKGIKAAHNKSLKPVYKHLTSKQKAIVKLKKRLERLDKDLHGYKGFYATCPRDSKGAVDWDNMTSEDLDYFERINKEYDKISAAYNKIDLNDSLDALKMFNATQFNYSQSF